MRRAALSRPTIVVVLGIVAITVLAAGEVRRQVAEQKREELQQRTAEVALTLSGAMSEVRSALGILASLPVDERGEALFEEVTAPLVVGNVRLLALVDVSGGSAVVRAATGDGVAAGDGVGEGRAELVARAAAADDVVSSVLSEGEELRIGFAIAADRDGGEQVVVRELAIDPSTPVDTLQNQLFGDVDLAVYAGSDADEDQLVLRTDRVTPLRGDTLRQTIPVGSDEWVLVTASRGTLVSTFAERAPWATLTGGLVLAALLGVLIETMARRRRYAEALVAARTEELEATLAERSRFEAEARRASARAEAANRSKSEFLSRMSHELRTPLNAVLGFAQLLELEPLTASQHESVDQIGKAGHHLLDLINEVLDITRIETGTLALSPEPVEAAEVMTEVIQLLAPIAEQHRIHLLGEVTGSCDIHVYADRQRLKQILLNLVANGIKYNRVGGTVSLHCASADPGHLRINVTDTGLGIPDESLERLFEPFERLGAEASDIPGTGIGLALSRRLAEAMDGSVDVDTTYGRGSTFWVELPIVEGPVERFDRIGEAPRASDVVPGSGGTSTILYIEDNLSNLRLVQRVFEHRGGIQLISAMQGRLGIDLARQHRPDVILLDLHLPDVDGEAVLRELREDPATSTIPVILLSAEATQGRIQRLIAAGARSYLTKPLDVRRLLLEIDQLLAGG